MTNTHFSGDTDFFSFASALRGIANEKLTGRLRCSWTKENVELYTRAGEVVLVTTRDAELYCSEAPVTLVNIDPKRVAQARATQSQNGCPLFITLAGEDLILRDPALQLVQHYGLKLFARLWTASRVRFAFEQTGDLPDFTQDVPSENDMEDWMLHMLRFVQLQDVADKANYDPSCIPAYTRYGFERVQKLRLTATEAQFAGAIQRWPFYCPDRAYSSRGSGFRPLNSLPFCRARYCRMLAPRCFRQGGTGAFRAKPRAAIRMDADYKTIFA
jgi:hypothetical protein